MVDLGDARNFQKRSLNMPKQLKIRINTCDGRRIFFFSVLASSSFSLYVRAVREHGPGPGRRLRGLCWTPRSKALPVCRGLGPAGGASAGLAMRPEGRKVAVPWPVASSPRSFLRIWWKAPARRICPCPQGDSHRPCGQLGSLNAPSPLVPHPT